MRAGPFSTIQDTGRRGRGHQGVARSGAFDQNSFRLANRLVGNGESAATIEVLLGPFEFEAGEDMVVAATGTNASIDSVSIDGRLHAHAVCAAFGVRKGERVIVGVPRIGLRTYLSFSGGLLHEQVLGSSSYDSLGQIGPPPLRDNDELHIGGNAVGDAFFEEIPSRPVEDPVALPFRLGPREDWLLDTDPAKALSKFLWTVDSSSNRTGIRLDGTPLARREGDLASEAMILGAIQLPPSGLPIVLGPDGGTTGGYPVVGVVPQAGIDLLAQCRPGQKVRLHPINASH